MADTLPAVEGIDYQWTNVFSYTGIDIGFPVTVQNTGSHTVVLFISEDEPAEGAQGTYLYPLAQMPVASGASGLWVRSLANDRICRLQVDIIGGVGGAETPISLFPDSLQIQISSSINPPDEQTFLLVTNNTTSSIALDQIVNAQSFATGEDEGTSIISLQFIFNPDLTGAAVLSSDTKAYANGYNGVFVDITGVGILFNVIEGLDDNLNQDWVRVAGGQVTYFTSNQSLSTSSLNGQVTFQRAFSLAQGGQMLVSFDNVGIIDGGCEVFTTALISGVFLSLGRVLEVAPDDLLDDIGNNLVDDIGDQLTT